MKIDFIQPVSAYCVAITDGPYVLRLDTPDGNPVWYDFDETGFKLPSQERADELEAAFQKMSN